MNYITRNMIAFTAIFYILLFFAGMAAWYSNGMGWTKFDLNFIWQGISTLFGAGVFSSIKYIADSCKNSEQGKDPYQVIKEAVVNARTDISPGAGEGSRGERPFAEEGHRR